MSANEKEAKAAQKAERKAAAAKQAEERRKMFEEMAKKNGGNGAPPPRPMWGTPEGGEVFGKAREDLDWVDPKNRFEKK